MDTMVPGSAAADPAAAVPPRLAFRVPPTFFELPVKEAVDQLDEALIELAQDVYPQGNAELWFQYVAAQLPVVLEMREAGVGYAGFCLLDIEGRRSTATVTATVLESVPGGGKATASSVAAELAGSGDGTRVETFWLAAGEAVARFTAEITQLPGEITDSGRPEEVEIGKISVFLPLRRTAEMVLFELSTPCMEDWDLYSELFFNIVNTLEVNEVNEVNEVSEVSEENEENEENNKYDANPAADANPAIEVPLQAKPVRDVFG
ncbi:hypothetical protein [Streptomyces sp. CRN 30]|uniref:hypothetical protein n=1 Tax=Streptomyces sp. CRN 30 TaxID=3075613 RepID=UPI002A7F4CD2|nr:hypothetical protein [Streptomyces sp. CRN 30]